MRTAAIAAVTRHPWRTTAAIVLAAIVAFVLVWFQPQKLWIDEEVDDAAPATRPATTEPATATASDPEPESPSEPTQFRSLDHETSGRVLVLAGAAAGTQVVRFEDLNTSNGPDLRVYLSTAPPTGPRDAFDDDYVELGRLKGNIGDQNYDVPPGTDLARFQSVVIWCKRFSVPFAAAPLS